MKAYFARVSPGSTCTLLRQTHISQATSRELRGNSDQIVWREDGKSTYDLHDCSVGFSQRRNGVFKAVSASIVGVVTDASSAVVASARRRQRTLLLRRRIRCSE